ncbi:MAG: hypothetical protein IKE61_05105 [Coriobacteriales bacterium]|nr:hypothetical protein [Coriobacteriales bacterium]
MAIRQDYLMRMILDLATAIAKALRGQGDGNPDIDDLEFAIGDAVNMDPELFFSLDPDSMVLMLQIGDLGDEAASFVVRSMLLDAMFLQAEGKIGLGELRRRQAEAIASAFGCDVKMTTMTVEELAEPFLITLSESDRWSEE